MGTYTGKIPIRSATAELNKKCKIFIFNCDLLMTFIYCVTLNASIGQLIKNWPKSQKGVKRSIIQLILT